MITCDKAALIKDIPATLKSSKQQFKDSTQIEKRGQALLEYHKAVLRLQRWVEDETGPTKQILQEMLIKAQSDLVQMQALYKQLSEHLEKKQNNNLLMSSINIKPLIQRNQTPPGKRQQTPSVFDQKNMAFSKALKVPMKETNSSSEAEKFQKGINETIVSENPNVRWDDISGLKVAKESLQEAIILPIKFPHLFQGARSPWKGILLYGPPGTGKTYLAKACATEADSTFMSVSSADLLSKFVGESEKMIKALFTTAREMKLTIIFIDEIDSVCGAKNKDDTDASRRVKTEFLVQMQGVGNSSDGVLVLGATNLPWALDEAVRRRFEKRIYIPLPDAEARYDLIKRNLKNTPNKLSDKDLKELAKKTDGYSGSDISVLVRDAAFEPVRKCQRAQLFAKIKENGNILYTPVMDNEKKSYKEVVNLSLPMIKPEELKVPDIEYKDFLTALTRSKPSINKEQLLQYENWTKEFGQDG